MDSDRLSSKRAVVVCVELPSELLQTISGCLQNITDIIRFRSVCRSWRLSTSIPPNKISPFFPLTLSYTSLPPSCHKNLTINSTALYLLRPRSNPSRVRMVSVQESVAGKLLMRHALTHEEFPGGNLLDLSSDEWSSAIQIARSYTYDKLCDRCTGISESMKLAFVPSNSYDDPKYGCDQLVGLCQAEDCHRGLFTFIRLHDKKTMSLKRMYRGKPKWNIMVIFMDWDDLGNVCYTKKKFVVSDGDLYMVLRCWMDDPPEYRLVRQCKWERVWDLGNRVLFITNGCSFSVSARDLPHPCKGNCIVFADSPMHSNAFCRIYHGNQEIKVFQLGDGNQHPQFRPISSLQGYSDLFALLN